jgi:plastocyanin
VTIAAGDSLSFTLTSFHTVTFPGKSGSPAFTVPNPKSPVKGVKDAAGNPFFFNGLPSLAVVPAAVIRTKAKTYDGSKLANSGLPSNGPGKPFVLKFTKVGTYHYICLLHTGMAGTVTVKARGAKVPSAKANARALRAQVAKSLRTAKHLAKLKVAKNVMQAGAAGAHGVEIYRIFTGRKTYAKGTVLTTQMSHGTYESHTLTTGPRAYLGKIKVDPVPDPRAVYPSQAPGALAKLTHSLHGNGFWNSGYLDDEKASTTIPFKNTVKLSAAGTYRFICVVHPDMVATIKVK